MNIGALRIARAIAGYKWPKRHYCGPVVLAGRHRKEYNGIAFTVEYYGLVGYHKFVFSTLHNNQP